MFEALPEIHAVLQKFTHLFYLPTSLLPHRVINQRIHFMHVTSAVNVKPYRYPHMLKQIITQIVEEMLQQGLVRLGHIPYPSPVLLVHKKDGTYRFCVDYNTLNAITVKHRLHFPMIDELLDELGKATIFSKLGLRFDTIKFRCIVETSTKVHFTYQMSIMSSS